MRRVTILGAGRVASPLIRYLTALPEIEVTVADAIPGAAAREVEGVANASAITLDVNDERALSAAVEGADLVVSMIPPYFHPLVARQCLRHKAQLVTTSYVSPEIRALDEEARAAGLLILMESGEDPGIDHMSTKRLIDEIHSEGGKVEAVRMYCGGLLDFASNRNPFNYKFSWSPKGVFLAAHSEGIWIENGEVVRKDGGADLFAGAPLVEIPGGGTFETYPNRDGRVYPPLYGIPDVPDFYRGLLRFPGWCPMMWVIAKLGYLDTEPIENLKGRGHGDLLRERLGLEGDLRGAIADRLSIGRDDNALTRLEWAGLFGDEPVEIERGSIMDVLVDRLERQLPYDEGDRDLIVLHHEVDAVTDGKRQRHLSTLIKAGDPHPDGETAMSRAVGYPAAIAAHQVLDGKVSLTGVQIPVFPEIYNPVLDGLAEFGIEFDEFTVDRPR